MNLQVTVFVLWGAIAFYIGFGIWHIGQAWRYTRRLEALMWQKIYQTEERKRLDREWERLAWEREQLQKEPV